MPAIAATQSGHVICHSAEAEKRPGAQDDDCDLQNPVTKILSSRTLEK